MSFTSLDFLLFFLILFILYWLRPERRWQNSLLLAGSYVFYGWVHPWYALMLGASTLADHVLARRIVERPEGTRRYVALSLAINLGVLAFFKYYNFFSPAVMSALPVRSISASCVLEGSGWHARTFVPINAAPPSSANVF